MIYTVKGFGPINKAEVDIFFWNSLVFSYWKQYERVTYDKHRKVKKKLNYYNPNGARPSKGYTALGWHYLALQELEISRHSFKFPQWGVPAAIFLINPGLEIVFLNHLLRGRTTSWWTQSVYSNQPLRKGNQRRIPNPILAQIGLIDRHWHWAALQLKLVNTCRAILKRLLGESDEWPCLVHHITYRSLFLLHWSLSFVKPMTWPLCPRVGTLSGA